MYPPKRHRDLSSLAQGSGFYRHGVEVECYIDNVKAYTLMGQPILKPSISGSGKHAKPFKNHKLGLPKTYVTRRGQLVLFTAPEDMVMGNTCVLHQKEGGPNIMTPDNIDTEPTHLRGEAGLSLSDDNHMTCNNPLLITSYRYSRHHSSLVSTQIQEGAWQDQRRVEAGHFTDVHLRNLQEISSQVSEECTIEDIEEEEEEETPHEADKREDPHKDLETPLLPDCDSGLGHSIGTSSGRLSSFSHPSEATPLNIPHGSSSDDDKGLPPSSSDDDKSLLSTELPHEEDKIENDNELETELSLYKVEDTHLSKQASRRPSSKRRKKRRHLRPSVVDDNSKDNSVPSKPKSRKPSSKPLTAATTTTTTTAATTATESRLVSSEQTKLGRSKPASKSKKRREKKRTPVPSITLAADSEEEKKEEEEILRVTGNGKYLSNVVSSVEGSIPRSNGGGGGEREERGSLRGSCKGHKMSRADERRMKIERRRAEKRELKRLKEEEELANSQIQVNTDKESDIDDSPPSSTPSSPSHESTNQQQLLESVQQAKLRENRKLLALRGEGLARKLSSAIDLVQEAIKCARQAAEEVARKKEMEEKQKQEEEEEKRRKEEAKRTALAKRAQMIKDSTSRLKNEVEVTLQSERNSKKYQNSIGTNSILFSYFKYVPLTRKKPDMKHNNTNKNKGKRPQVIRS